MSERVLTKGDCMKILSELEQAVEDSRAAMGRGPANEPAQIAANDTFRRGKLHAYRYAIARIESMMQWKGVRR